MIEFQGGAPSPVCPQKEILVGPAIVFTPGLATTTLVSILSYQTSSGAVRPPFQVSGESVPDGQ